MVDKNHIINFLRINGVSPSDPVDVIEATLYNAGWSKDDTQIALQKLQNNYSEQNVNTLKMEANKLFFSDASLDPNTLTSLLGVHVFIPSASGKDSPASMQYPHPRARYVLSTILIVCASVLFSVSIIFLIMYFYKINPFSM